MQLTDRIHLVGSGDSGFGLTEDFDCHVYLVDGGEEWALIDAGIGPRVEPIMSNVDACAGGRDRIRYVLVTHAHPDHSGGCAYLRELLPHVEVVASPDVARCVATGDQAFMSLDTGKKAGFYPSDYRFTACRVDRGVGEGDVVRVGDVEVGVLETPGHSDGHLTFVTRAGDRTVAFCGDVVFFGGLISLESNWDCRIQDYAASIDKLAAAGIDALLPGHHSISLRNGGRHVDSANRMFQRGFVPKSIV